MKTPRQTSGTPVLVDRLESRLLFSGTVAQGTLTPSLTLSGSSTIVETTRLHLKSKLKLTSEGGPFSGSGSFSILLSPDETAADSVFTLSAVSGKLQINANKSKSFPLKLPKTIPASVAPGTYHVLMELAGAGGTSATIDSGESLTLVAPVVDLTGSVVKVPGSVKSGKRFSVVLSLTNTSAANVPAVGKLPLQVGSSPDGLITDESIAGTINPHINIKPGKTMRFTFTEAIFASTFIVVNLDPGDIIFPDVNPANNNFVSGKILLK